MNAIKNIQHSIVKVDYDNLVNVVSRSLDLVGVDDIHHAKRIALMVSRIAEHLVFTRTKYVLAVNAALLHDCGVSSTRDHRTLIDDFTWLESDAHCLRSAEYLRNCVVLSDYADCVRHHHTPWRELVTCELSEDVRDINNLIFLCDRVDALGSAIREQYGEIELLLRKKEVISKIASRRGDLFAPVFVDAFIDLAQSDAFWLGQRAEYLDSVISPLNKSINGARYHDLRTVRNIATFMARIIDAKSPFTIEHSERVALLCSEVAALIGLPEKSQKKLEIAGLLHDVGKLRIPDEILEKNGPLTPTERAQIHQHALDTRYVTELLFPGSAIALWASSHHEQPNGRGYPSGLSGEQVTAEMRVLSCCDVFQALTQERPYRGRLTAEETFKIMDGMAKDGDLDLFVLSVMRENADLLYDISTG